MKRVPVWILIPIVLGLIIGVFYFITDNKEQFDLSNVYVLGVLFCATILLFAIDALDRVIENYKISLMSEEEKKEALALQEKPFFQTLYESAFKQQSEKEEKELIIDHGFDGITELDNNLPKWWLGLFYLGIFIGSVYALAVATTDFADPEVEYDVAVAEFEANYVPPTYDQFIAETTLDTGKVPTGKAIFETNCVTCHSLGGAGGAGPNLTDDFWKNQFTDDLYTNIATVVWKGIDGSAMKAWGENADLSPAEIEEVAAYVHSLRGVKPPGKPKVAEGTIAPWAEQ